VCLPHLIDNCGDSEMHTASHIANYDNKDTPLFNEAIHQHIIISGNTDKIKTICPETLTK